MLLFDADPDMEALKRDKYDAWVWNFGRLPKYDMTNNRRWPGGGLEIRAAVKDGTITGIVFFEDFLSRCALDEVEKALRGGPLPSGGCVRCPGAVPPEPLFWGRDLDEYFVDTVSCVRIKNERRVPWAHGVFAM